MRLSRRFFVAYFFLVAVPLALLLGVLHFGRNLAAPPSVQGTWSFNSNAAVAVLGHCGQEAAGADLAMVIRQSGQSLMIELQPILRTAALGEIHGTELLAATPSHSTSVVIGGCSANQPYSLSASVDVKAEPPTMAGALHLDGCPLCPLISFRAIRRSAAQGHL